jgi:CRISPR-associated exonuclease Cas4
MNTNSKASVPVYHVPRMYSEDDLLPISALQHLAFCERQWALIHLEQQWVENRLTAEGRRLHQRADDGHNQTREGVRICRGLHLRSLRLGLTGKGDVVEFHPDDAGNMRPFSIEYKRGRPKPDQRDEVQLCAQALCLEEMLNVEIANGALFYGEPRRRTNVDFDAELRTETERLAARLHELNAARITPKAKYERKRDSCSLYSICLPKSTGASSAQKYLKRAVAAAIADIGTEP